MVCTNKFKLVYFIKNELGSEELIVKTHSKTEILYNKNAIDFKEILGSFYRKANTKTLI